MKKQFNLGNNFPFKTILKGTSRSFYLSTWILPKKIRRTVGLTYLLARAADTLCDTSIIQQDLKKDYLNSMRELIKKPQNGNREKIQQIIKNLNQHKHSQEVVLIQNLESILFLFHSLPPSHFDPAKKVLLTLTQGMVEDLNFFSKKNREIQCLNTKKDTERYTYLVAGCVGEFWTDLLREEILPSWPREKMVELGIRFGKGLQMTNILRDLPKDLSQGRCYLSQEDFQNHSQIIKSLQKRFFSDSNAPIKENGNLEKTFLEIYREKINLGREWLKAGLDYVFQTPRKNLRLRLSVLWPLLIGLDTLNLLEKTSMDQLFNKRVRIKRHQVYQIMASTILFASNNSLLYWYYKQKGGNPL